MWFWPGEHDPELSSYCGRTQPLAAIVSYVWSDTLINIAVFDPNGGSHGRTSVRLWQGDGNRPTNELYAEWMPYQKAVAAKNDALEAQVKRGHTSGDEAKLDAEIVAKGLTAPRVTPLSIDSLIVNTTYTLLAGTTVTICALTLRNGFISIGHSACASPENFDPEIGRNIAFDNARNKLWELEGYTLMNALSGRAPFNTAF